MLLSNLSNYDEDKRNNYRGNSISTNSNIQMQSSVKEPNY